MLQWENVGGQELLNGALLEDPPIGRQKGVTFHVPGGPSWSWVGGLWSRIQASSLYPSYASCVRYRKGELLTVLM